MPRTSELGAGVGDAEHGRGEVEAQAAGAEDGVGPRSADVERLRDEAVAHALRHAAGAAVGRDLAPTAAPRRRRRGAWRTTCRRRR